MKPIRRLATFLVFAAGLAWAAHLALAGDTLADRHGVRAVGCADCHGKSAPQTAVTTQPCIACHGAPPRHEGGAAPDCFACHSGHGP